MRIKISEVRSFMVSLLRTLNLSKIDKEFLINHFLKAELAGKTTHGVGKFFWESQYFAERLGKPFIEKDKKSIVLVNANKEIGPLAAKFAIEILIKRAKKYGIALVGVKNSQRYGSLETLADMLAANNLIGLIMNTSESLVPHPDGTSKILGTNPLGIGIPTNEKPIIVDMATSKEAMGLTWQAIREGRKLPKKIFIDRYGNYTTEPSLAKSVEVFGGYKGFGLSLFIQILSTAFLGILKNINGRYDSGCVFIAIDPSIFVPLNQFKENNARLMKKIKLSKKRPGVTEILLPGEHARRMRSIMTKRGYINISKPIWEDITRKIIR